MRASGRNLNEAGPGGLRSDRRGPDTLAVDEILFAAFSGDACSRAYAWVLLEAAASGWRTHAWPGGADPSASPRVYLFLDRLIAHSAPAAEKVRLLASLLRSAGDDRVADLIADVLLAHGDAAVVELLKRWDALRSSEEAGAAGRILPVLARTGTPFVRATLGDLDASDARRIRLGLAATEALARGLDAGRAAAGSLAARFLAARHDGAVPAEDVDPRDVERLRGRVRALVDHAEAALREAALRGVSALQVLEAAPALRGNRVDPGPSSRPWTWGVGDAAPAARLSLEAALRFAFPEARPYEELELSRAIGRVVFEVSSTRRMLVELGLLAREGGRCTLTALGEAAWRVERFVRVRPIVRRRGRPASEP